MYRKIENYYELSENLIDDFQNPNKLKNVNSSIINSLGRNILNKTMKILDDFLNNNKVDLIFTDLNSDNTKLDLKKVTDKPICVIIGPEGDFSEEERAKILKFSGVQPLKINDNILRSETAVISAISIIKYAIN